jgi:hypothetical protein
MAHLRDSQHAARRAGARAVNLILPPAQYGERERCRDAKFRACANFIYIKLKNIISNDDLCHCSLSLPSLKSRCK